MISLTPEVLSACYEFLRTTQPYKGWNLPHSDDIEFHVTRDPAMAGHYARTPRLSDHEIGISEKCVGHNTTLVQMMGHEMVHLHQNIKKTCTSGVEHNSEFNKLLKRASEHHGWDWKFLA